MLHVIDTSNAREVSKAHLRDTLGVMEGARARIIDEATSSEIMPSTAAALLHTASMLKMLYLRLEGVG